MSKVEIPKVKNLEIGQVVKNYKELCLILEIKPRTGEAKQIQMRRLSCIIDYHKDGHKFIIDNINDIDKTVLIDKRTLGNNTGTSIEIGDLILHELLKGYRGGQLTITINQLLLRLKLVSKEYKKFLYEADLFHCETGINYKYLRKYRLKLGNQLNKRVESALRRLKNIGYIHYEQRIHLKLVDEDKKTFIKVLYNNKDMDKFLKAKTKALDELNSLRELEGKTIIDDINRLIICNEFKRFRKIVCKLLSIEFKKECDGFWEGYIIKPTVKALEIELNDKKYNQNIDYIKGEFYKLLGHSNENIKSEEIRKLELEYKKIYDEEINSVIWGEPTLFKSYKIEFEINNIRNLERILIG